MGNETLCLAGARTVSGRDLPAGAGFIVTSDGPELSEFVKLAMQTEETYSGRTAGGYAIPKTGVRIWRVEDGRVAEIEQDDITYLEVKK